MTTLGHARLLLFLAAGLTMAAAIAALWNPWYAGAVLLVAALEALASWDLVRRHRDAQEEAWRQRRGDLRLLRDLGYPVWPSAVEMQRDYLRMIQGGAS